MAPNTAAIVTARRHARLEVDMYCLGVDLGTTFSAAAVAGVDGVEVFTLGTVAPAIPSVVVLRADGEVLVGEAAERRALTEPGRTAREFKRRLGDPTPLVLAGTPYGAEALMARMLRWIVDAVAQRQGGAPDLIVVTHPANYGPYKLDLLKEMVRLADVGPVEFLSEPEAAAINYAEHDRLDPGQAVAVYDFGGGTFDAAVLRKSESGFELLGRPEGMERLGGIDFDHAVFTFVDEATGGQISEADTSNPAIRAAVARLRADCRAAKESLSTDTDVAIPVLLPGLQTEVRLTRTEFEAMVRPRVQETVESLERAIRSSGLALASIDRILLVGGSSRIPLVAETVKAVTGRPTAVDAHPKFAITLGAARFGAAKLGAQMPAAVAAVATVAAPPRPSAVAREAAVAVPASSPEAAARPALSRQEPVSADGAGRRDRSKKPLALVGVLIIAVLAAAGVYFAAGAGGAATPSGTPAVAAAATTAAAQPSRASASRVATASVEARASAQATPSTPAVGGASIVTFAGSAAAGSSGDGGPATSAEFARIGAVAVGPNGAVYIADYSSGTVRVVRGGTVSAVAKGFLYPDGLAVDPQGNVFVADTGNHRVVRIDTHGTTTTIAGQTGTSGAAGDGGPATSATLWAPKDVSVDAAGNVYIADTKNNRVRKVDTAGVITTVAGKGATGFGGDGGPATAALLAAPTSLAVAGDGTVYVGDSGNGRIRKIAPDGTISTVAGNGQTTYGGGDLGGPPLQDALHQIDGVALDAAGNVYADLFPSRTIVRITAAGALEVVAGGGQSEADGVAATEAYWSDSWGMAIDLDGGTLYIAAGTRVISVAGIGQGS